MHLFVFYAPSFESVFMAMDGSTTASFTPTEIRAVIKFFTFEGMSTRDAHDRLVTVVGDSAPSYETTRRWMREFENGRVSTEDLDRSGRPPSATLDDFVGKVQDLLQESSSGGQQNDVFKNGLLHWDFEELRALNPKGEAGEAQDRRKVGPSRSH